MQIERLIRELQQALHVTVDGRAGPETWSAIHDQMIGTNTVAGGAREDPIDERSERAIATLQPEVRPYARALVHRCGMDGIEIVILSGLRSYAKQDELYAQGRDRPGRIVTRARGGYSTHNFGIAFDVGVFEGSRYYGESPKYKAVGMNGLSLGLDWGGNWRTFRDEPHFQLRPAWASGLTQARMLAELRRRKAAGTGYYA